MSNELLDDAKYAYTEGWATIQAVGDRISVIAHEVNPPDRGDLDRIYDQLREVGEALCALYGLLVEEARDAMNPRPKGGDPILDDDRYTDGSWVWTVRPPDSTSFPVQAIHWGNLGPDFPPGCEVIIADPPHRRKSKLAFKALKVRLLEAER
jgi:hypothetical protein